MVQKTSTRFPGVRSRAHSTRKHGIRPDTCFFIRHRVDGKIIEESCGWESEGMTAAKAYQILSDFKENTKTGSGPRTFKELKKLNAQMQQHAELERIAEEQQRQREAVTFGELFDAYTTAGAIRKKPTVIAAEQGRYKKWLAPLFKNM
ncbi:MAG: hypothetical protein MI745_11955, partial [Pseudomonadales bacterium]|nr:hypothetical protein [Pseudomonadales bacterium]